MTMQRNDLIILGCSFFLFLKYNCIPKKNPHGVKKFIKHKFNHKKLVKRLINNNFKRL